ncbi:hypothetical protein MHY1_02292 [Methylovirgula sp. HY1]|nr:hypothetical protein MHY1_02292 [Methylovirgula sp. HY1]
MVRSCCKTQRMRYGTDSIREHDDDRGAVRRAIQNSQASLRALAKDYGINQKTVAKWKKREAVSDLPTGPKAPHAGLARVYFFQCRAETRQDGGR